jgi:hypothetical protein
MNGKNHASEVLIQPLLCFIFSPTYFALDKHPFKWKMFPYSISPGFSLSPADSLRAMISPIHSALEKRPFKVPVSLQYFHYFRLFWCSFSLCNFHIKCHKNFKSHKESCDFLPEK